MSKAKFQGRAWVSVAAVATVAAAAAATSSFHLRGMRLPAPEAQRTPAVSPLAQAVSGQVASSRWSHDIGDLPGAPPAVAPKAGQPGARATYTVLFNDAPLASYRGGVPGLPVPKRALSPGGRQRLDVKSAEAVAYVDYLAGRQRAMEQRIGQSLGISLPVRLRMQHALNGIIVDMTPAQAARVARMPGVKLVEADREEKQATDVGPTFIGAVPVWTGQVPAGGVNHRGEGMVVGIIDSGINFGAPSFSATGPVDGYVHANPFGAGTYVGTCASGGVDQGRCNDKLVGGYDFVCGSPGNKCNQANVREEPGFGDTNGHGSHVASTAAGNSRDVTYEGASLRISGVAPHANVIAYDVCYTDTSTEQGLCPTSSSTAAVNQAVANGVVDALNFSIGGGTSPWSDSVSLAFLNAVDAGIFVAAAAGNDGPSAGSVSHDEPWVSTTAAVQHGRGPFSVLFSATGPTPVPANVTALVATQGTGGVAFSSTIPATTPLRISAGINATDDGCAAFPANTFSGAIAVVRRGTCNFTVKAGNAAAAGAVAIVIANNQTGVVIPSVPGATIPVFALTQADGDAVRDFGQAHPSNATAQLPYPPVGVPNTPDVLADFSSRGPSGYELIKPDIAAPGVAILAAVSGTTLTGSEQAVDIYDGTSMASPHNAGAALLVRQVRPDWTPMEVKSALMMTSTDQVYLEDGVTLADPNNRGAGRVRVDRAVAAGLVLNETKANFQAANPNTGGSTVGLNLASMADTTCNPPSCSFTRTFRNTRTYGALWAVSLEGLAGTVPALLWVPAGTSRSLTVTIDATALTAGSTWHFGKLVLRERFTANNTDASSELHLPVGVIRTVAFASRPFYPGVSQWSVGEAGADGESRRPGFRR